MTARERWLAALELAPVDRLPFWPKLDGAYPRAQGAPFREMPLGEIHNWIGSDKHIGVPGCGKEVRRRTSFHSVEESGRRREVFTTPRGALVRERRFDEASQSWHPVKMPVQGAEDIAVLVEWYEDAAAQLDAEALESSRAKCGAAGEGALTTTGVGESPLMHWVEHLAGVERAHYLLADLREDVEALFEAMHASLLRRAEILLEHSPADLFYMVENTSTTLISPEQYRRYCLRHIDDYASLARSYGRRLALHMCGHLKALLPDLATLDVAAFEAFTSPPVGNTRLEDGRRDCPRVCLIGGTNAALWTRPAGEIIAELERDLARLPHHRGIVVTSGGVMPPLAEPEKIRTVCEWVKSYPARM
jgi:uroporphyrinogen-III decarboxylase